MDEVTITLGEQGVTFQVAITVASTWAERREGDRGMAQGKNQPRNSKKMSFDKLVELMEED